MKAIPHYRLNWMTEEEPDEEWLPGEQISRFCYCNNKTELANRHQQAVTEGGYNFSVDVWCWNQYMASNVGKEWD